MRVPAIYYFLIMTVYYANTYTTQTTDKMRINSKNISKHVSWQYSISCKIPHKNVTSTSWPNKKISLYVNKVFGFPTSKFGYPNWLVLVNNMQELYAYRNFMYRTGQTDRRVCRAYYPECIFFNGMIEDVACRSTDIHVYHTLNRFKTVIRDSMILPSVTLFVQAYRSTKLFIINVTCGSFSIDQTVYVLLPITMKQVSIIDTHCEVNLFISPADIQNELSAVNLTGSRKTVFVFLIALMNKSLCSGKHSCKLDGLVSLDISNAYLYDKIRPRKNLEEIHTKVPALKNVYARKIVPEACVIYVKEYKYASCILFIYTNSKLRDETHLICIDPETLEILGLADNNIEYIDSSFTNSLINLKMLDISNNLLHISYGGAGISLGRMTRLTIFYCSNNELRTLPVNIFDTLTNLTEIDLSSNKLKSITFRVQHLYQLRFLNLCNNEIKVFESLVLKELSNLVMHKETFSNRTIKLDLFANPFQCSCETKATLIWILEHEREIKTWPLSCLYDGKSSIINSRTLEYVEKLCRRSLYIGIACLLCTITAFVIIVSAVAIYRHQLGLRKEQRLLHLIRKFKEDNARDRFPAFLSFSSSNADFVMENVFDKLNTGLQELLGTNRRCVAIGDADFRPGALVIEEMIRCISKCDMVIICVSNEFLRSPWCTDEVRITHYLRKTIILMFLEEADKKLLTKSILLLYFSTACRAKWTNVCGRLELQPNWHAFCDSVVSHMATVREHVADQEDIETIL